MFKVNLNKKKREKKKNLISFKHQTSNIDYFSRRAGTWVLLLFNLCLWKMLIAVLPLETSIWTSMSSGNGIINGI